MALDTYTALQTTAATFLNRTDLTAILPDFVTLAEAQIVRQMMGRSDATINSEYIAVPDDFLGARAMYLAPNYRPLDFISPEEIVQRKTLYPSESGDPQAFTVVGPEFQFWPWNTGTFTGELTYWKRPEALSASVASNWLLDEYPDIYLYTTLIQSAPYLGADERLQVWGTLAATAIDDLIGADRVARTAPHLSVGIVPGGTP